MRFAILHFHEYPPPCALGTSLVERVCRVACLRWPCHLNDRGKVPKAYELFRMRSSPSRSYSTTIVSQVRIVSRRMYVTSTKTVYLCVELCIQINSNVHGALTGLAIILMIRIIKHEERQHQCVAKKNVFLRDSSAGRWLHFQI